MIEDNFKIKIVASVQVRMGSSRLPGKVMSVLAGKPVLKHIVDRAKLSSLIDEVIVCTSTASQDDVIHRYCKENGIACFRGSEDNVIERLVKAMHSRDADVGVTLFGDCPCVDPAIIDQVVSAYLQNPGKYDFVGNDLITTYPPGLEVEAYKVTALEDALVRLRDPSIAEHGTLFIRKNPNLYKLLNIEAPPALHFPDLEIELDTNEDLLVMRAIFGHFYDMDNLNFNAREVIEFLLSRPDLQQINSNVPRRWKKHRRQTNNR